MDAGAALTRGLKNEVGQRLRGLLGSIGSSRRRPDSCGYAAQVGPGTTNLLKDTLSDDLIRVIGEVSAGAQPALGRALRVRLDERANRPTLTRRERQVLILMSEGLRNKEIAAGLNISEQTVQVHVKNILSKLDAHDRTGTVAAGVRRGLIRIA